MAFLLKYSQAKVFSCLYRYFKSKNVFIWGTLSADCFYNSLYARTPVYLYLEEGLIYILYVYNEGSFCLPSATLSSGPFSHEFCSLAGELKALIFCCKQVPTNSTFGMHSCLVGSSIDCSELEASLTKALIFGFDAACVCLVPMSHSVNRQPAHKI